MDIIGSRAQGDKITAKVSGNLNIETLQEKENYEEQNSSMGFGISWGVKAKDKQTSTKSTGQTQNPPTTNATKSTPKPNNTKVPAPTTERKFFAPFEQYLKELRDKYLAGTKIRSDKYPEIDGQHLQGKQILEIPASNQTFEKIDEYKAIANRYKVEIRFREE